MTKHLSILLMAVFVLLAAIGCTSILVGNGAATHSVDGRSGTTVQADSRITSEVKSRMIHDSQIDSTKILVDTRRGVVTLTGQQASSDQISRAVLLARSVKGVRAVVSKLVLAQ